MSFHGSKIQCMWRHVISRSIPLWRGVQVVSCFHVCNFSGTFVISQAVNILSWYPSSGWITSQASKAGGGGGEEPQGGRPLPPWRHTGSPHRLGTLLQPRGLNGWGWTLREPYVSLIPVLQLHERMPLGGLEWQGNGCCPGLVPHLPKAHLCSGRAWRQLKPDRGGFGSPQDLRGALALSNR